ncbi:MAG TPA: hypothetical protein VNQ76_07545 [Planctomicrobium sp.]|nr:hypothetical protein [Planctomicrobium sp.]
MRSWFLTSLALTSLTICGCDQPKSASTPAPKEEVKNAPLSDTELVQRAREHVQECIDRALGGDLTMKSKLLTIYSPEFDSLEELKIQSAVPQYLPTGEKVPDFVRVTLLAKGYSALRGRMVERTVVDTVSYRDGQFLITFGQ